MTTQKKTTIGGQAIIEGIVMRGPKKSLSLIHIFSRLELGAEQTFDEDIDLHALCAEAVRRTAVLCENRGLTVEYDNTHITVRTDGDLLDQVPVSYTHLTKEGILCCNSRKNCSTT